MSTVVSMLWTAVVNRLTPAVVLSPVGGFLVTIQVKSLVTVVTGMPVLTPDTINGYHQSASAELTSRVPPRPPILHGVKRKDNAIKRGSNSLPS